MTIDYNDPAIDEKWCSERRAQVMAYLKREKVKHGRVGEWPAWHLPPYASIWAIESAARPEWVGWWVICGDLPTDHFSAESVESPRDAMREFAQRWQDVAALMEKGQSHPSLRFGPLEEAGKLGPLLGSRSKVLSEWASRDDLWDGYDER